MNPIYIVSDTNLLTFLLTPLSYSQPSSINLTLNRDGGHYYSVQLSIPSGSYDGQLVVGKSSIHPVKRFNVNTESGGKVVLEFDVATGREKSHGSATGGVYECDGIVHVSVDICVRAQVC